MADLHIDDFHRDVARILVALYASFPRKVALYVEDISGPNQPDEFGLPTPRFEACFSAMTWLAEEGYLRFDSPINREALDQAVLTQRAFLLLASPIDMPVTAPSQDPTVPPSLHASASTGVARLRAVLRDGLAMDADRGQHGVQCLGANAALERRAADLAEEGLECSVLRGSVDLRCRAKDEPPRQGQADEVESLHAPNDTGRASGKARSFL